MGPRSVIPFALVQCFLVGRTAIRTSKPLSTADTTNPKITLVSFLSNLPHFSYTFISGLTDINVNILLLKLKDWCWSWSSNTLATWCEELTAWKRSWCWERLKAGEGDNRECDGWMALPTQWTGVWASSGSWWWTGKSGMLQSMESQRIVHDWKTELNWTDEWADDGCIGNWIHR